MLSKRIISFFSVFLSLSLLAFAVPTGPAKRAADVTDITGIFTTLKSSTDSVVPQINTLASSQKANEENIMPLLNQLNTALNDASNSLNTLELSPLERRQAQDEVASLVAGIISDVTTSLDGLLIFGIPTLSTILFEIEIALHQILLTLDVLIIGVLSLIGHLLFDIAAILTALDFTLLGGLLGIL